MKWGIQLLPLMLATVVSSVVVGGLITAAGYYTPFLIVSTAIAAIGDGLITMYDIDISTKNRSATRSSWAPASVLASRSP
jgi:hypothetical protein